MDKKITVCKDESFRKKLAELRVDQCNDGYIAGRSSGFLADPKTGGFFWIDRSNPNTELNLSKSCHPIELKNFFIGKDDLDYCSTYVEDWYLWQNYFDDLEAMRVFYRENSLDWKEEVADFGEEDAECYIADVIEFCDQEGFKPEANNFDIVYAELREITEENAFHDILDFIDIASIK